MLLVFLCDNQSLLNIEDSWAVCRERAFAVPFIIFPFYFRLQPSPMAKHFNLDKSQIYCFCHPHVFSWLLIYWELQKYLSSWMFPIELIINPSEPKRFHFFQQVLLVMEIWLFDLFIIATLNLMFSCCRSFHRYEIYFLNYHYHYNH